MTQRRVEKQKKSGKAWMQPLKIRLEAMARHLDLDASTLSSMRERLRTLVDSEATGLVERCANNNALLLLIGPICEAGWPSGPSYAFKPSGVPGYFQEQHVNLFQEPEEVAHLYWDGDFWVVGSGSRHAIKRALYRTRQQNIFGETRSGKRLPHIKWELNTDAGLVDCDFGKQTWGGGVRTSSSFVKESWLHGLHISHE